jgi:hypothetical protein
MMVVAFGHEKVSVLDGGLPRWIAEGNEVEVGNVGDVGDSEYPDVKGPDPALVRCEQCPPYHISSRARADDPKRMSRSLRILRRIRTIPQQRLSLITGP